MIESADQRLYPAIEFAHGTWYREEDGAHDHRGAPKA
jgi:hypothetical protein